MKFIFNNIKSHLRQTGGIALFLALSHLDATGQNKTVSMPSSKLSIAKVFEVIEKETNMSISFNQTRLDVNKIVAVDYTNKSYDAVLADILKGTGFTFQQEGRYIVITPINTKTNIQSEVVTGIVRDQDNNPIAGVSVNENGTANQVITDASGRFSIKLTKANAKLLFSHLSFEPKQVAIGQSKNVDVNLDSKAEVIDDVVVVGYGTQKKVNLTGAVSTVTGSEMVKRPVVNAATMLQGRVPGLSIIQNSGQPGVEGASFRIRGQGTYSGAGSDPLILINGVPGSMSTLDPNIIESVSVLKDAASAAIYGSRAANGVVLVTTKKGAFVDQGKSFSAIYSGNLSFYSPTKMLNTVSNSAEYMTLFNQAKINSQRAGLYDEAEIEKYRNGNGSDQYPNFDWVDYMFEPAFVQNHNLSLNGNTENTTYNLSINAVDQPGTMRGFEFKKYNFTIDLNSKITNWLKTGTYISANYNQRSEPRNGAQDAFLSTLAQAPTAKPWLLNANSPTRQYTFGAYPNIEQSNKNMLAMIDHDILAKRQSYDLNGQFFIELNPFKGLKWHTKIAGRLYNDKLKDWSGTNIPLYNYSTGEFVRNMDLGGGFIPGLQVQDSQTLYTNLYSFVEYEAPLENTDHNLKVMVGYNQEKNTDDVLWAKRRNYQFNLPELNAGGTENQENSGYKNQWAIMSGFSRLNYNYQGKYLVEANVRYDGTSRIASENRWGWFPSFSAGYRLTEESFMRDLDLQWLNDAKIRGSWGKLGNQNIGLYPYQAILSLTGNYPFDNKVVSQGVAQTSYVNRNLRWEATTITDLGVDLKFFNRLDVVFDWYKKETKDILRGAQVSSFIGLTPPTINNGEMINKGVELSLNWKDVIRENTLAGLGYTVGVYFDRSRNTLSKFGTDEKGSNYILREGLPYNSFYVLDAIGVFANQAEIDAAPKQFQDVTRPGDLQYNDVDGNGKIDFEDRVVVDGRFSSFEYSFNLGASWRAFDLSAFFQGVEGRKLFIGAGAGVAPFAQGSIITQEYIDGMWTEENPTEAKHPKLYFGDLGGTRNTRASTYFLRDASYLRLKNLHLGYSFPATWTQKAQVQKLRLFFSGDNLFTSTQYEGLDPENGGSFLAYPQNKIFSLGVQVEF